MYPTMKEIFRRSAAQKRPPSEVADQLAEERLSGK
jgi:hypothetical protein